MKYGHTKNVMREYELMSLDAAVENAGGEPPLFKKTRGVTVAEKEVDGATVKTLVADEELFAESSAVAAFGEVLLKELRRLLKKNGFRRGKTVLAVGLGNEEMTADALGAKTVDRLLVTGSGETETVGRLAAFKTSVGGITGLDTYDLVAGISSRIKPDIIIAVDTLATKKLDRLCRAVQITDGGIAPGSGVGNEQKKLCGDTLGCPVIAVGVPLVIYLKHIVSSLYSDGDTLGKPLDKRAASLVVTPKEIDADVNDFADVVAYSINAAVRGVSK